MQLAEAVGPEGKVFGIDLSEEMRARARERVEKEHVIDRVELSCGDATRLPYPDGSMDAVFVSFTLELFDTPEIPQALAGASACCARADESEWSRSPRKVRRDSPSKRTNGRTSTFLTFSTVGRSSSAGR